jgi:predicted oxidoreductase (fatty acid repression mutant protein)
MSVNIKDILDELYALDPDLREKESEIKKIIEKMMKNRPEVEINETFRSELREKIMREIASMKKPAVWLPW